MGAKFAGSEKLGLAPKVLQNLGVLCELGHDLGGVQNVWGEENIAENAPSRKILDPPKELLVCSVVDLGIGKTQQRHPRGGWKTYQTRGVQNPLFGRGVIREAFLQSQFSIGSKGLTAQNLKSLAVLGCTLTSQGAFACNHTCPKLMESLRVLICCAYIVDLQRGVCNWNEIKLEGPCKLYL